MKKIFSIVLLALFSISAGLAKADPPMKVVYSQTVSTNFTFHWPQRTVRTYNAVQTKPYHYIGQLFNLMANEDLSKYRFHYSYMLPYREWGYFFPPGTKLYNHTPYIIFEAPRLYQETVQNK
jgi:hypothetical protein